MLLKIMLKSPLGLFLQVNDFAFSKINSFLDITFLFKALIIFLIAEASIEKYLTFNTCFSSLYKMLGQVLPYYVKKNRSYSA